MNCFNIDFYNYIDYPPPSVYFILSKQIFKHSYIPFISALKLGFNKLKSPVFSKSLNTFLKFLNKQRFYTSNFEKPPVS